IRIWADIATTMERQQGFVSTRFSRSPKDPIEFVKVAVWDDETSFRKLLARGLPAILPTARVARIVRSRAVRDRARVVVCGS
ncbi:MAG: antibiotic biosynthesis monooxygenase, partial [Deinococcales bacterium]